LVLGWLAEVVAVEVVEAAVAEVVGALGTA